MKKLLYIFSMFLMTSIVTGCLKDDDLPENPPPTDNEGEVITTLRLHFTDAADTTQQFDITFLDPDGAGGAGPTVYDTIRLAAGKTWHVSLSVLNESDPMNPEDITEEILEEAAEHLFCFSAVGLDVTFTRTDSDGAFEVGLESNWTTGASTGTGTIVVTLKHQPDGEKNGTCEPGDTDVEIAFVGEVI